MTITPTEVILFYVTEHPFIEPRTELATIIDECQDSYIVQRQYETITVDKNGLISRWGNGSYWQFI